MGVDPKLFQAGVDPQGGSLSHNSISVATNSSITKLWCAVSLQPSLSLQDWEQELGPHISDSIFQSSAVSFGALQVATNNITGTYTEGHQQAIVTGLVKIWQHSPDSELRQEENFSRRAVGLGNSCLQPPLHGGPYFYHSSFPPISLAYSGSAGPAALLESTSGFSSALKNLFSLLPEPIFCCLVSSVQPHS